MIYELFGADFRSGPERTVLKVCAISLSVAFGVGYVLNPIIEHLSDFWANILTGVVVVASLVFIATFIMLGVRVVGRSAGKTTWSGQATVTFGRVFLFLLLPCLLFAIGSVVWMILNGRL
jgi:hypothetical protein